MQKEIERKFFIRQMPDVSGIEKTRLERHFLFDANGIELRIQTSGTKYILQRKESVSERERTTEEISISKEEFDALKALSIASISRESYHLSDSPKTDIRIYSGPFEGLIRAEFEFSTIEEMAAFQPQDWAGNEMTGSPLARDSSLLKLSPEEFRGLL